ncbi:MAG: hypothetical protein U9N14_01255, partial [Pseudomonadota bacterium]|nr:hypothetical protein [Pseudomonadota bacterium]
MSHHNTFLHDVIAQVLSKSFVDHHGEALNSLAESAKLIACGKQSSGYTRLALIYGPVVATAKDNAVARRLTITVNIGRNRKSGVMSGNVRLGISHFTGDESRADDLATVRIVMGESGVWQLGKANVAGR